MKDIIRNKKKDMTLNMVDSNERQTPVSGTPNIYFLLKYILLFHLLILLLILLLLYVNDNI